MQKRRKTWRDLSPGQRIVIGFGGLVELALLVAALRDIRRRDPELIRGGKWLWTAISFVNFVGPITYFLVGRKHPAPAAASSH